MKTITRKDFLRLSIASSLAVPLAGYAGMTGHPSATGLQHLAKKTYADNLGFQVFAFRDMLLKDAKNLFKSFAESGVKTVEFFNPATLNEYVPIVKDNGMSPLATHFMPGYITGNWEMARKMNMAPPENYHYENIIEDCVKNGIKYMGIAILLDEDRPNLDAYKVFAEKANKCGELSKAAGVQLYYHSHNFEFQNMDGTTPYEEMLKVFDHKLVKVELDVFWLTVAKQDPIAWIRRMANHMLFLHLKDLKKGTELGKFTTVLPDDSFVELGTGMIDYKTILAESRKLGIKYVIVDQDKTRMTDKIASVKMNCDYIKSLGI
jgi:sugar phosphate isomerase/epimerase